MRKKHLAVVLGALLSSTAHAGSQQWTVSEASSGVVVLHKGMSKAAVRGGHLEVGDVVTTGPNARAVLINGDQYAVISPNSRLEVADSAPSNGLMQFIERIGNAVFSVKKGSAPHFGVQTPYLAAVVKGTTFSVTVDDTGSSVQVVEGAVEVSTLDGGAHRLLLPGAIATIGANDPRTLTIQGKTTEVLHSNSSANGAAKQSKADSAKSNNGPVSPSAAVIAEAGTESSASTSAPLVNSQPVTIQVATQETPVSIGAISGGLVSGSTGMQLAMASTATNPPAGPGSGKASGRANTSVPGITAGGTTGSDATASSGATASGTPGAHATGSATTGTTASGSIATGAGSVAGGTATGSTAAGGTATGSGAVAGSAATGVIGAGGAATGNGATAGSTVAGSAATGGTGSGAVAGSGAVSGSGMAGSTTTGAAVSGSGSVTGSGTTTGTGGAVAGSGATTGTGSSITGSGSVTGSGGTITGSGSVTVGGSTLGGSVTVGGSGGRGTGSPHP